MCAYIVKKRGRKPGTYAIYEIEPFCLYGSKVLPLGKVTAWSKKHAENLAVKRGLGEEGKIFAIEVLGDDRVTCIEDCNNPVSPGTI